jgi:hypothetical protein
MAQSGTVSPDPVTDAAGYQRLLVGLVGDDDPAAIQEATPKTLRSVVNDGGDRLRRRPAEKEWSVLELIGHITDAEVVVSARYRWVLAHDKPALIGYDQDLWVERLRHNQDDPEELLAVFRALRKANLALWRRTSAEDRRRVGLHAERGPESYDLIFRLLAGHDRFHLSQIRETLEAVKSKRP